MFDHNAGTRSRYCDLNALNQKMDSYGSGLCEGTEAFSASCNQSLDVLLNVFTLEGISNARLSNDQRHYVFSI